MNFSRHGSFLPACSQVAITLRQTKLFFRLKLAIKAALLQAQRGSVVNYILCFDPSHFWIRQGEQSLHILNSLEIGSNIQLVELLKNRVSALRLLHVRKPQMSGKRLNRDLPIRRILNKSDSFQRAAKHRIDDRPVLLNI